MVDPDGKFAYNDNKNADVEHFYVAGGQPGYNTLVLGFSNCCSRHDCLCKIV